VALSARIPSSQSNTPAPKAAPIATPRADRTGPVEDWLDRAAGASPA
jgi:hypothetical protein